MSRSFPGISTVGKKNVRGLRVALNSADHVCFLTHLTAHLTPDAKPPVFPQGHLRADPDRARKLRESYRNQYPGKRLIGFSWSTSSTFKQSARTIPMDAWQPLLGDQMLTVDYEEMVNDFPAVSRKVIAFLGLDWEAACLHPERNSRAVRTASRQQVREPVHGRAVDTWRRFEAELEPLLPIIQETRAAIRRRSP